MPHSFYYWGNIITCYTCPCQIVPNMDYISSRGIYPVHIGSCSFTVGDDTDRDNFRMALPGNFTG